MKGKRGQKKRDMHLVFLLRLLFRSLSIDDSGNSLVDFVNDENAKAQTDRDEKCADIKFLKLEHRIDAGNVDDADA